MGLPRWLVRRYESIGARVSAYIAIGRGDVERVRCRLIQYL
jgi:hypothetical protein